MIIFIKRIKANDFYSKDSKDTWAILMNFSERDGEVIYAR